VIKVRDGGTVDNKAAHLVIGVDLDGYKHVLGIWIAAAEGARFWGGVLAELRNRGLKDTLFVCCDGLNGLPEAIESAWPRAIVQTCVIHLIRASMRYVSWEDRKKTAAALRPIYTAVNEAAAKAALDQLRAGYGKKAPGVIAAWERAWPQFIPFLEFDVAIRKVIYTTNAIVIWSPRSGVRHVDHEGLKGRVLRGGRGYLPLSIMRIFRRNHACSAGAVARLVA